MPGLPAATSEAAEGGTGCGEQRSLVSGDDPESVVAGRERASYAGKGG